MLHVIVNTMTEEELIDFLIDKIRDRFTDPEDYAEIGNPNRFANDGKVAKFVGLTWNQYESGSYSSDKTPLNKCGNTYLRYYLIQTANSVKNHCSEFQSYYCKKYSEATKHHHKRALVLTARKMLRTLFKLLQSKVLYDSSKCTFAVVYENLDFGKVFKIFHLNLNLEIIFSL